MAISVSTQESSNRSGVIRRDRIGELTDPLLLHILSLLPSKQAISTSLLSKRWRLLWRGLSHLDVDDLDFQNFQSFAQFVDAVLIVGHFKPLKKFRIYSRQNYSFLLPPRIVANQITIWIYGAINRNVEQLELIFPGPTFQGTSLPRSMFVCNSIQDLRLSWVTLGTLSYVNLPSLKVLSLYKVEFTDSQCVAMLLSGCPLLKKVLLVDVDIRNGNISSALNVESLQHLASASFPAYMMILKAFSGVKILRLCQNMWSASHNMPTYDNFIRLQFSCYAKDWARIVKCLQNCPKLQILCIRQALGEENTLVEPIVDVPQCISSHLKAFYLGDYKDWNFHFQMVRFIMKEAKVLTVISILSTSSVSIERKHQMLKRLSKCPRSSENCELLFE